MKDIKEVMEYILKNKYVIICVAIVVLLYSLGVIGFITKFIILLVLIAAAIYLGKKMQDNESILRKFLNFRGFKEDNVYYYQDKEEKSSTEEKGSNKK